MGEEIIGGIEGVSDSGVINKNSEIIKKSEELKPEEITGDLKKISRLGIDVSGIKNLPKAELLDFFDTMYAAINNVTGMKIETRAEYSPLGDKFSIMRSQLKNDELTTTEVVDQLLQE